MISKCITTGMTFIYFLLREHLKSFAGAILKYLIIYKDTYATNGKEHWHSTQF